ncbi:hypothetical protein [Shewanella baltica]|uniref:hypothetical protein n=1 Tax=Shewanella baltica TaxID=62322 RepID=UPI00167FC0C2|nr:hypothetical protein [Shewanella baltica]
MNISIYAAVEPSATSLWRVTGETMAINAARTQVSCRRRAFSDEFMASHWGNNGN